MDTTAGDHATIARQLCDARAWADLMDLAQRWHREDPANARALFYRGVALAGLGRFTEAETVYRQALERAPTDFKIWNNLAAILFEAMHRPLDAIRCMERAMTFEPENKLGWSNLASMVGQLGRHEKAMEFADRALALDPHMVEAHLHKATAAQALGRADIVKEVCERLASLETDRFRRTR